MAEKNFEYTPYVYTGNNPIKFIDPDGQDWYEDENCNRRYDEKLTKANHAEYLKDKPGSRYLGETHTESTKNGTNNYRKDGSVMFGSQSDAVDYMVKTTELNNKEQFGFIKGDNVLVAPDKFNDPTTSDPYSSGYNFKDGTFTDPVDNKSKDFDATVHTHPKDINYPSTGNYGSGEDVDMAKNKHPNRVGFVLGLGMGKVTGFDKRGTFDTGVKINQIIKGTKKFPKY